MSEYLDAAGLARVWAKTKALVESSSGGGSSLPTHFAAHNGIFRGKDLTAAAHDGRFFTAVASGDFSDIYVGDYITATVMGVTTNFRIAEINWHPYLIYQNISHVVIVPDNELIQAAFDESGDITSKGYCTSDIVTTTLPSIKTELQHSVFSQGTFQDCDISVCGSINSDGVPDLQTLSTSIFLLSEVDVFGQRIFEFYNLTQAIEIQRYITYNGGYTPNQMALFRLNPDLRRDQDDNYYWLRSVYDGDRACGVGGFGGAYIDNVLVDALGVRPAFVIG